ncbi:hypothetical protein PDESU_01095 [Pontiella desulfatans]|uniref:PEP-CTERM protein-sorting domain-containing protein n=1 Tax=Pontiella desulfatans TaxID=2750659 RepID=A0A6C2TY41_PONDE|nr:hypothetical protein [Pontiella desulfatans]VGO12542.1 hypothetical protein PDESU_01095 [Pontiella desulfatans]
MKKTIAILTVAVCAGAMSASAALLVGWDDNFNQPNNGSTTPPPKTATGFSGLATPDANLNWSRTASAASTDGTFGTLAGAGTETGFSDGLALNNGNNGHFDFTVTNGTADDYDLDFFHFDAGATRPKAADNWTLSVLSGALTVGNVTSGVSPNGGGTLVWAENDLDLTGLADNTLEAGQSVVFRLDFVQDGTIQYEGGHNLYLDNIAISGTVIPEPATLGLVAAFGGAVLFIRHRFMI